jgi:hypothetical protein
VYAPVQPLVLTSDEWREAAFALLDGETAWEKDADGNVYMLRGDGLPVKGGVIDGVTVGNYTRLRVDLTAFSLKDSSGNNVNVSAAISSAITTHNTDPAAHGGIITEADTAISTEQGRAQGIESGLQNQINAHAGDSAGTAHGINTHISSHNTDPAAHGGLQTAVNAHAGRTDNPHSVTKAQIGLGNADNTGDMEKPVSVPQAAAIAGEAQAREGMGAALRELIRELEAEAEGYAPVESPDFTGEPCVPDPRYERDGTTKKPITEINPRQAVPQGMRDELYRFAYAAAGEHIRLTDAPGEAYAAGGYERMLDAGPGKLELRDIDHLELRDYAGLFAYREDLEELEGLLKSFCGERLVYVSAEGEDAPPRGMDGGGREYREWDMAASGGGGGGTVFDFIRLSGCSWIN